MKREYIGEYRILRWLYENNHSMKWLSDKTNIPYSTIKRKLSCQTDWKRWEIDRILSATGETYERLFRKDTTA